MVKVTKSNLTTSTPLALSLSLLCSLFIVYGSWLPFQPSEESFETAIKTFLQLWQQPSTAISRIDFATNILLAVPLAFFASALLAHLRLSVMRYLLVLSYCLLLAFVVEFGQLMFNGRVSSPYDVIAQGIGAVLGILLWRYSGYTFWPLFCNLAQEVSRGSVWLRLALLYGLIFFIYNVLPLDITLNPEGIYDKWKAGRILLVPFHYKDAPGAETFYAVVSDFFVWIPLSFFVLRASNAHQPAVLYIFLYSLMTELVQLIVISRVTDSSDVIYALLAVLMLKICKVPRRQIRCLQHSAIVQNKVMGSDKTLFDETEAGLLIQRMMLNHAVAPMNWLSLPLLLCYWSGWSLVLLLIFWYPFDFSTAHLNVQLTFIQWFSLPFAELFRDSVLEAVTTVIQKLVLFAPLGWLLFMLKTQTNRFLFAVTTLVMLGQLVFIEVGQIFLVGRVSNLTDVLIGFVAVVLAFVLSQQVGHAKTIVASLSEPEFSTTATGVRAILTTRGSVVFSFARRSFSGSMKFVVTVMTLLFLAEQSFVPYNLRELLGQGDVGQAVLVSVALFVCFSFWALWFKRFQKTQLLQLLALLFLHSQLFFWLLFFSVPLEVLQDVVGASNWQFLPIIDMALRFSAFLLILQLPLLFNAIMISGAKRRLLPLWIVILPAALILWHLVVVVFAVTDNITELLAGGGSWISTFFVWLWLYIILLCNHWLGTLSNNFKVKHVVLKLLLSVLCLYSSYELLTAGLEQNIYKYGNSFSAMQFLLSPDRNSYLLHSEIENVYYFFILAFLVCIHWFDLSKSLISSKNRM